MLTALVVIKAGWSMAMSQITITSVVGAMGMVDGTNIPPVPAVAN